MNHFNASFSHRTKYNKFLYGDIVVLYQGSILNDLDIKPNDIVHYLKLFIPNLKEKQDILLGTWNRALVLISVNWNLLQHQPFEHDFVSEIEKIYFSIPIASFSESNVLFSQTQYSFVKLVPPPIFEKAKQAQYSDVFITSIKKELELCTVCISTLTKRDIDHGSHPGFNN